MKKTFLLGILTILFINCNKGNDGFIVNGRIEGDFNRYIYLKYNNIIDSSLVLNNTFSFKGKVSQPVKGILYPDIPTSKDPMTLGIFMLENSTIDISINYSERISNGENIKFFDINSIIGSKSQDVRSRFDAKLINTVLNEENDSVKMVALYDNLYEFLSDNPKSTMSAEYLADLGGSYNQLNGSELENLLKLIDTSYQHIGHLNKVRDLIIQRKLFRNGNTPPEIVLPNEEGEMINRLSFNGKFVLLEFWASWCAPCRQANPELLKIYNSFNNEGFEILGISIDQDLDAWKTAIKEDGLSWTQVIDSLRSTTKTYNLNSIPYNLLLNREGQIIAQNVKPIELREILKNEL